MARTDLVWNRSLLAAAITGTAAYTASAQQVPFTVHALPYNSYPTLPPGTTLGYVGAPWLAEDSTIVFPGTTLGPTIPGIFIIDPSGPRLLARKGEQVGTSGWYLDGALWWVGVPLGGDRVIFSTDISQTIGAFGPRAWLVTESAPTPVVVEYSAPTGLPVPHLPGIELAARGDSCLVTSLQSGVWYGSPTALGQVAQVQEAVPGIAGRYFHSFWSPSVASADVVGFKAMLSDVPGGSLTGHAIFRIVNGQPVPVLRTGVPAPSMPTRQFTSLGESTFNAAGQILFPGNLTDTQSGQNIGGLWILDGGDLRLVAQMGAPAPGTGGTFSQLLYGILPGSDALSDGGHALFVAEINAVGTAQSLWIADSAGPKLLARAGDPVPGFPASYRYAPEPFLGAAVNTQGQAVFVAKIVHPGPDVHAVMLGDTMGRAVPILRSHTPLPPNPWNIPQFNGFERPGGSGGVSGRALFLNDAGRIALAARIQIPGQQSGTAVISVQLPRFCYPNCDLSAVLPALNVADFTCFLGRFAAGDIYANCDRNTGTPALTVADFTCFLQQFAAGCP